MGNGSVEKVAKFVRESTFALIGYDPHDPERDPKTAYLEMPPGAAIDEDAIWNAMIDEISKGNAPLAEGLEGIAELVSAIRKERIRADKMAKAGTGKPKPLS